MTYTNIGFGEKTESDEPQLAFGYRKALAKAPDLRAAWGQRAIMQRDSESLDMVWDRRAVTYHEESDWVELQRLLDYGILDAIRDRFASGVRSCEISFEEPDEIVLFEDDEVLVIGNSSGSCGYFYITAILKSGKQ